MTTNTDTQAHGGGVEAVRRIADLLDENAECYSENAMDRAFLGNSEELAALIVEYLALAASPAAPAAAAGVEQLRFVFDRFPCPGGARFVEVEDENGRSLNAGEWRSRDDGLVELVLHRASPSQGV